VPDLSWDSRLICRQGNSLTPDGKKECSGNTQPGNIPFLARRLIAAGVPFVNVIWSGSLDALLFHSAGWSVDSG
jgi:hypothetical protein